MLTRASVHALHQSMAALARQLNNRVI